MRQNLLFGFLLATSSALAQPFYEGQLLAHPVINNSQDSAATIAFINEKGGVKGYYCLCEQSNNQPRELDDYGNSTIESVFYADLGSKTQQMLVLFKNTDQYRVHAYQYQKSYDTYQKLTSLQPALDRLTKHNKVVNAALIKKALAKLESFDYSAKYIKSGIPDFDAVDHSQGVLVGYFGIDNNPVNANTLEADIYSYKKTFQKKDKRWLTVTYRRGPELAGELSRYRIDHIAWEISPQHYTGSEDGAYIMFDSNWHSEMLAARGQYTRGKRTGTWEISDSGGPYYASGDFLNDLRQGKWREQLQDSSEEGVYIKDMREGRWEVSDSRYDEESTGFDTYKGNQRNGPSERYVGDQLILKGEYEQGHKRGFWIEDGSEGNYEKGIKTGHWKLKTAKGNIQEVEFVEGKKHGLLRELNQAGALLLEEHYNLSELDGPQTHYINTGALIYSANYVNGKLNGQELGYSQDGMILLSDIFWSNGVKHGPYKTYHSNGKPYYIATYDEGEAIGNIKIFAENGHLLNEMNRCRWNAGGYFKIDRCGQQRTYNGNGQILYDGEYLFGHDQASTWYSDDGKKSKEIIIEANESVTKNYYYEKGQLKCTEHLKGYSTLLIEGKPYKDYNGARLEGEARCFYENGIIKSRTLYRGGIVEQCTTQYDETGKQTFPGPEGCPKPEKKSFTSFW